jgi:hypothetical protein
MIKSNIYRLTIILFILTSCKRDYTNKKSYEIKIGQTFELYITSNTCCINCWLNKTSVKSITLDKIKSLDTPAKDCLGCTYYDAWVFKGTSIGKDTIKITQHSPTMNCEDSKPIANGIVDYYIVTVTK